MAKSKRRVKRPQRSGASGSFTPPAGVGGAPREYISDEEKIRRVENVVDRTRDDPALTDFFKGGVTIPAGRPFSEVETAINQAGWGPVNTRPIGRARRALLADVFVATPVPQIVGSGSFQPINKYIAQMQQKVRTAEKFVFNPEASRRVAEVLIDVPELIAEQAIFARPPFDLCWIEYSEEAMWTVIQGHPPNQRDLTRDDIVGILIDHHRCNVVSWTFAGEVGLLPFTYHLNTEWPLVDQIKFAEAMQISRAGIDQWLWGGAYPKLKDNEHVRALRDVTMVEFLPPEMGNVPGIANQVWRATVGDFKNLIACLLMLNQPKATEYVTVPRRQGWVGNKRKPYMAHHTVTVSLKAKEALAVFDSTGAGDLRRRHRVRGHYCHDQTARDYMRIAGCVHEWQPCDNVWRPVGPHTAFTEDVEHWVCTSCGGKRWWRADHERGDAARGWVNHTYNVKP